MKTVHGKTHTQTNLKELLESHATGRCPGHVGLSHQLLQVIKGHMYSLDSQEGNQVPCVGRHYNQRKHPVESNHEAH